MNWSPWDSGLSEMQQKRLIDGFVQALKDEKSIKYDSYLYIQTYKNAAYALCKHVNRTATIASYRKNWRIPHSELSRIQQILLQHENHDVRRIAGRELITGVMKFPEGGNKSRSKLKR